MGGAEPFCPEQLFFYRFIVYVVAIAVADEAGLGAGADEFQAMAADVYERFGIDCEADDGAARLFEQFGRFDAGDQGDVGGFDAAVGEIEAGGGFGGAGDADENDIGFRNAAGGLAVVMGNHVVHGVNAAEVIGVQHVLAARLVLGRQAEFFLQDGKDRVQNMQEGDTRTLAKLVKVATQRIIDQRAEDRARFGLDAFQDAVQLQAGADQAPAMVGDMRVVKLRDRRAGQGGEGVAGGVGNQVDI